MIDQNERYMATGGGILAPSGPSTWDILDFDQRRVIAVKMDGKHESEDLAIEHLKKHIHALSPDVYEIYVAQDGSLISTSTDPRDDKTLCPYYPPLDQLPPLLLEEFKTVTRFDLREIDRLGPNVDLVSYQGSLGVDDSMQAVFKYYTISQYIHRTWDEMNLWMRLPRHPNVVPFDRVVVDELEGRIVGFTSVYIPGGTLKENRSRVFKLKWLEQLTRVVDDLNLRHGIMHQDIAARNLLVDPATDNLLLFDFDYAARIGITDGRNRFAWYSDDRDDVKGVIFTLYEIITGDEHYRDVPHEEQDPADVQNMSTWPQRPDSLLDHPVSEYRSVLDRWVKRRQAGTRISVYTEAQEPIDWPALSDPPKTEVVWARGTEHETRTMEVMWAEPRGLAWETDNTRRFLDWQRPPQSKVTPETSS